MNEHDTSAQIIILSIYETTKTVFWSLFHEFSIWASEMNLHPSDNFFFKDFHVLHNFYQNTEKISGFDIIWLWNQKYLEPCRSTPGRGRELLSVTLRIILRGTIFVWSIYARSWYFWQRSEYFTNINIPLNDIHIQIENRRNIGRAYSWLWELYVNNYSNITLAVQLYT